MSIFQRKPDLSKPKEMKRPETTGYDISPSDKKAQEIISLLEEYINHLENIMSAYEIAGKGLVSINNKLFIRAHEKKP